MKPSNIILEAAGVAKAYGRERVLSGLSLQVCAGELVGIVGENGSGKTTLLNILVGLLAPDAGAITRRARMGYCPQEPLVFERLTVQENLRYFATAYGLRSPGAAFDWRRRQEELLEQFHFGAYRKTLVARLSGGTRQKLNLAIALFHRPALLVLDEPYSGFDWETYLAFWDLAGALRAEGVGILVVSHLFFDRSRFDRLFTLTGGGLRCESTSS